MRFVIAILVLQHLLEQNYHFKLFDIFVKTVLTISFERKILSENCREHYTKTLFCRGNIIKFTLRQMIEFTLTVTAIISFRNFNKLVTECWHLWVAQRQDVEL